MIALFADLDIGAIEALLCDADGCLFPSEEPAFVASAAVTNELMAEIGGERRYEAEELRRATSGQNFRTTAAVLAREQGRLLEADALERWVAAERLRVTDHLAAALEPDREVSEPLSRLHREYDLALVSSSAIGRLEACLEATALDELFPEAVRFSAESSLPLPTSKPDPAVYELALKRLGIPAENALAIEDSEPGVSAAVAAGIPTLGNVTFVPAVERRGRIDALAAAGAAGVIYSWRQLELLLSGRVRPDLISAHPTASSSTPKARKPRSQASGPPRSSRR
jgi:beta-phosphoglucomutase-like phosphatase (HAD superfamily)